MMQSSTKTIKLSYVIYVACLAYVSIAIISAPHAYAQGEQATYEATTATQLTSSSLAAMDIWDDGLAEMSYYHAVDTIYGKHRSYTRAVLVNRQWMHPQTGVKTDLIASDSLPVFKINIVEEIPTENYNYRYQTTMFLTRQHLQPFKMVASSQEWCGTTFKHLRWIDGKVTVKNFSYFSGEGDSTTTLETDAVPYESLLFIAREVAASKKSKKLNVLEPIRSTHSQVPNIISAELTMGENSRLTTPLGTFQAVRIDLNWSGQHTSFVVQSTPPFRLLRYHMGGTQGSLVHAERRAYWNRDWPSSFHKTNHAP